MGEISVKVSVRVGLGFEILKCLIFLYLQNRDENLQNRDSRIVIRCLLNI